MAVLLYCIYISLVALPNLLVVCNELYLSFVYLDYVQLFHIIASALDI